MTTRSFVVVDDVHLSAAPVLQKMCNQIDEAISEYISILNMVTAEAAKAGHTTERYNNYAGMISGLKGQFNSMGNTLSGTVKSFVEDIDAADSYLY